MADVTRRSVLTECLEYERDLWKLTSEGYDMRIPMKGMEDLFAEQRKKCELLQDMLHALESEQVRCALADWQKDVMQNGPTALKLDGPEPQLLYTEKEDDSGKMMKTKCPKCGGELKIYIPK